MQCRVQFTDRYLDRFNWCKYDESEAQVSDCGSAQVDELRAVCSGTDKVIVFLPQQDILLTSVNLPPRASKQQMNAIAFAVEDQLAEDIESCFFANLGQQEDHSVPIAVLNRQIMDNVINLLNSQHINCRLVLPQAYLCPWSEDADVLASICPVENGYLVRYGLHAGLYCNKSVLPEMLDLLQKQATNGRKRVDIYTDELPVGIGGDTLTVKQFGKVDLLAHDVENNVSINLKQKEYQSTHAWLETLKHWKWPAAAMVLLGLSFVANNLIEFWAKDHQYRDLISQQQALLQQHLPELKPGNQPKKQLIQVLAKSQVGAGQAGFLDMLHEYSTLKSGFNKISTDKILYQQSKLVVNLESSDLKSMESLREKLQKSRFKADIENVNINPDKTTGRLVMEASQ